MVGRRASRKKKFEEEDDDDDNSNIIKKMKFLHQIEEQLRNYSEKVRNFGEDVGAQPVGDVIRVSDDGVEEKMHYRAFDFDGNRFQLEDTVLIAPEEGKVKPSVSIIKDIFQTEGESLMIRAQRFYRPEEVQKKGGGTWESGDPRELFYSFYLDEIPANAVMHECVIHFVPLYKPLPDRKEHPGFIIRKFYDYVNQKLRILTGKDCKGVLPQSAAA